MAKVVLFVPGFPENRSDRDYDSLLNELQELGYKTEFIDIDWQDTTQGDWARKIDAEQVDQIQLSEVARSIESGNDTIVIGCTHYLAIEKQLRGRFRDVAILEPTKAVANRLDALTKERCYN